MPIPRLRDFLEPVLLVSLDERLADLLEQLQQHKADWAIATDTHGAPLGRLHLGTLLPLLQRQWQAGNPDVLDTYLNDLRVEQPSLLQPLTILPADWNVTEGWHWLHASEPPWVLVDDAGQVLGEVNAIAFWRHFAAAPTVLDRAPQPQDWAIASEPIWQISASTLASEPVATPSEPAASSPLPEPTLPLTRLMTELPALLELLPLPILLLGTEGQLFAQSLGWQQQIGEEARILQTIAAMEPGALQTEVRLPPSCRLAGSRSAAPCPRETVGRSPQPPHTLHQTLPEDLLFTLPGLSSAPASLHDRYLLPQTVLSDPPETEQFSDRIWQLTRIPLDVQPAGRAPLWLVVAQDITEQRQMMRELSDKTADLAQLNRLKDEFLSCISHELKTPLTAVLGLSSLLKEQLVGTLNDRQVRYAQLIYQSGRHLTLIVNDILDLTRIETGQLELNLEPIALESLCQRAYEQARQLHQEVVAVETGSSPDDLSEPEFSLSIQPQMGEIRADDLRLRQMLTNLLSNALKFTPAGGKVGLEIGTWDSWVAFTVWDTGIGIPVDKQHLIFQKFQQLENPLTRRFEGTGLGLVLTQRIARLHGGDVTFVSEEGKGSRFTLLLPKEMPLQLLPSPQTPLRKLQQRLVLVAESVPSHIEKMDRLLRQLGYRVAIARSGTEALEKVRRLQPALVILNPVLPLLSGWDVLTLLKASAETRAIPVIWSGSSAEKTQAIAMGASACLGHPVQLEAVKQCLADAMQPASESVSASASRLTVLHLRLSPVSPAAGRTSVSDLLHSYPYRVVEVSDLDQADLLARVWKPHVAVLEGTLPNPIHYFTHLCEHTTLGSVPLITLTPETTQAANRMPGLTVFPCLAPLTHLDPLGTVEESALFQVIQVASGQG